MNQKSGNGKYDIVTEAEAVLDAYAQRCKVYAKKSAKRQRSKNGSVWFFIAFALLAALLYWGIYILR